MNQGQLLDVRRFLGPGGIMSEARLPQIAMAEQVAEAITDRINAVIEAGTGTGKSVGYLLPAILSGNQTIVATATIALQEQLVTKDLPFLQEALAPHGITFSFGIAKGRANFLSIRRLMIATAKVKQLTLAGMSEKNEAAVAELLRIADAEAGGAGDRSMMGFEPSAATWGRVKSDRENCLGELCAAHSFCHYFENRRALAGLNIIVANHALLAADMRSGGRILPAAPNIIIDEGHHFPESVFGAFTTTLRRGQAEKLIGDVADQVGAYYKTHPLASGLILAEVALMDWVMGQLGDEQSVGINQVPAGLLLDYMGALGRILNDIPQEKRMEAIRDRLTNVQGSVAQLGEPPGTVIWAETDPVHPVSLNQGPIDVGPICQDLLYANSAVVYTSATLATNHGDMSYAKAALGLADDVITGTHPSPFVWNKQALLCLFGGLPLPTMAVPISVEALDVMERLVTKTGGRAFLLFTSRKALTAAWDALSFTFVEYGYPCARQGQEGGMSNRDLLSWFKETPGAVLFGLQSFWEGVSVEGSQLSLVCIDKIPFPNPSDPVLKAKEALITAGGGDPFKQSMMPQAILRLKQGLGRLIRTTTDRGIVAILDPRMVSKGYGATIIRALPPVKVIRRFPTDSEFASFIAP